MLTTLDAKVRSHALPLLALSVGSSRVLVFPAIFLSFTVTCVGTFFALRGRKKDLGFPHLPRRIGQQQADFGESSLRSSSHVLSVLTPLLYPHLEPAC